MLSRLFRTVPKWQSPKSQRRIEALETLEVSVERDLWVLMRLAREDSEPAVRRAAARFVSDLDVLTQMQKRDLDASVREAATFRLHDILSGKDSSPLTIAQRIEYIGRISAPQTLVRLVHEGKEPEIRLAAIAQLTDEMYLHDIAQHSPVARLRQAAAERIDTPALLEALAQTSRHKDKSVHRIVREKLESTARAEKAKTSFREKCEALCQAMEAHAHAALNPLYAAKAESLRQQWQEIRSSADAALAERFDTAFALAWRQVTEVVAQEQRDADAAQAREEMRESVETLEATLNEYRGQDDFDVPALAALLKTQRLRWELATQLQPAPPALAKRHADATQGLSRLEGMLLQWQQDRPVVEATLAGLETADDEEKALALKMLGEMQSAWREQGLPLPSLLQALPVPPETATVPVGRAGEKAAKVRLQELMDRVGADMEAGNSRDAARHLRKAQDHAREHHLHDARLAGLAERVRELKSWAGFAVRPKKEALIADMQALAGREMDPDDKADAIHVLQEAWRALGVADPAVEQPLWESFKAAGDKAFEPCRAHFASQRELRQQNLEKRIALCGQLEGYLAALPASIDWKSHDAILRTARREWQQYRPSDRQKTAAVQERFNTALHALEGLLEAVQKQHEAEKRILIARAQALLGEDDLRNACDQAKQLQQEWKKTGQAQAKTDQKLWQEFRTACDALFNRRDTEFKARQQARDSATRDAEALLSAYEELLKGEARGQDSEAVRIEAAFDMLALPREKSAALGKRLQVLRQRLDQARRDRAAQARETAREARLQDWGRQAAVPGEARTEKAEALLLDLEILLEIPSPEHLQAARRERQMQLLQSRGLRGQDGGSAAKKLLAEFLQTGPLPEDCLPGLTQRLRRVLEKTGA